MNRSLPSRAAAVLLPCAIALAGCNSLTLTALGVGAGAGVSHQMNGLVSKTFTAPLPKVKAAAVLALRRMDIRVASRQKTDTGEILYGRMGNRNIEIEIEAVSRSATRVRVVARKDLLLVDGATAAEIISQTQKAMESASRPA